MLIKYFRSALILLVLFLTAFCEKDEIVATPKPVMSDFEMAIRNKYDLFAVFRWSEYIQLLEELKDEKFIVLPLNEMRRCFDSSRVVVGLRHDVDFNPFKAVEMARLEVLFGFRATYFLLPTTEYYGYIDRTSHRSPGLKEIVMNLKETGCEIGIHNDLLTIMIDFGFDPYVFNREELDYFRSLRIKIFGTSAHGSEVTRATLAGYNIFSDFATSDSVEYKGVKYPLGKHSLKEYGFLYEAYKIPFNKYYSDSGGKWNDPDGLTGIIARLQDSKPGDRIEILVHPEWWGKK